MRIMFMGTSGFALPSLEAISEKHEIVCVVTKQDMPVGRKQTLTPPSVKVWAQERGIDVLQPQTLKNNAFLAELQRYRPDIIVVIAYGKILPKYILDYPRHGCINVHASLLPKYRGAAPIQWAIINGEENSGVTIMKMDEGLDTGEIISMVETPIGATETAGELFERLSHIGANAVIEALDGDFSSTPQPDGATYAPPITKEMSWIDWNMSARDINNFIRGLNPAPIAHTVADGDRDFKIFSAKVGSDIGEHKPGEVIVFDKEKGLAVATGVGVLYVKELQEAGGKRMTAEEYLRGKKIAYFCNKT